MDETEQAMNRRRQHSLLSGDNCCSWVCLEDEKLACIDWKLFFPYMQGSALEYIQEPGRVVGAEVGPDPELLPGFQGQHWAAKLHESKERKLDVGEEGEPRTPRGEGNQYDYLTSFLLNQRKGSLQVLKVEKIRADRRETRKSIISWRCYWRKTSLEILCSWSIIQFVYRHKRNLLLLFFLNLFASSLSWIIGCNFKLERRAKSEILVYLRAHILK